MNISTDQARDHARWLITTARTQGHNAARTRASYYQADTLPAIAAALATAVTHLAGPDVDDELTRTGVLSVIAAIEADARGDDNARNELLPDSLTEAYAQINTAVVMLGELLRATPDADEYLASWRATFLNTRLTDDTDGTR